MLVSCKQNKKQKVKPYLSVSQLDWVFFFGDLFLTENNVKYFHAEVPISAADVTYLSMS